MVARSMGMNPDDIRIRCEGNNAVKTYEQRILDRRSRLMTAFAMATIHGDREAADRVVPKIKAFNRAQPTIPITLRLIRTSVRTRMRYSEQAEHGIAVNRKLAQVRNAGAFAE